MSIWNLRKPYVWVSVWVFLKERSIWVSTLSKDDPASPRQMDIIQSLKGKNRTKRRKNGFTLPLSWALIICPQTPELTPMFQPQTTFSLSPPTFPTPSLSSSDSNWEWCFLLPPVLWPSDYRWNLITGFSVSPACKQWFVGPPSLIIAWDSMHIICDWIGQNLFIYLFMVTNIVT